MYQSIGPLTVLLFVLNVYFLFERIRFVQSILQCILWDDFKNWLIFISYILSTFSKCSIHRRLCRLCCNRRRRSAHREVSARGGSYAPLNTSEVDVDEHQMEDEYVPDANERARALDPRAIRDHESPHSSSAFRTGQVQYCIYFYIILIYLIYSNFHFTHYTSTVIYYLHYLTACFKCLPDLRN